MQDGRPVSFASRSLSETEINYAQIEKEFLAIVFACQKYHYYIYGRNITIKTDHKPLLSIMEKQLAKIPNARLQRMKLRLIKYNLQLTYVPGKYLYVADLLSRYFMKEKNDMEIPELNELVHSLNVSNEKQQQVKKEIETDESLNSLKKILIDGWPNKKKDLKESIRMYWKFKNELLIQDEIIYFNDRIIVPIKMRKDVLKQFT